MTREKKKRRKKTYGSFPHDSLPTSKADCNLDPCARLVVGAHDGAHACLYSCPGGGKQTKTSPCRSEAVGIAYGHSGLI